LASIVDRGTRAAPKFFAKYDFIDASESESNAGTLPME
jgi:hypothetical protein